MKKNLISHFTNPQRSLHSAAWTIADPIYSKSFHIGHIKNSLGMALSGGERRRVENKHGRARVQTRLLSCWDEPFAGVDPISVLDIKKIIQHLCQRGIGVLITDQQCSGNAGCV
ncbi:hypothetical protein ALON55S_02137 [Alishewanella longhuensis]